MRSYAFKAIVFTWALLASAFSFGAAQELVSTHVTQNSESFIACARVLDDEEGNPSEPLLKILGAFGIYCSREWPEVIEATQTHFLRDPLRERWDMDLWNIDRSYAMYQLFCPLKMNKTFESSKLHYDYAVILGATLQVCRKRFDYLKKEWQRGVRFDELVILGSERPLVPAFEGEEQLFNPESSAYPFKQRWTFRAEVPKTECEMLQLIFAQLELPEGWKEMPVHFINAPMKEEEGSLKRPNTKDTFVEWLKIHPKPGSCLMISSQPFIGRQDSVARQVLQTTFNVETIGPGFDFEDFQKEPRAIGILLDELARWIHQEKSPSTR